MFKGVATSRSLLARIIPVLVFAACSGDDPQVPTTLAPPSSAVLSGTVGSAVSTPPTVTLKDQKGRGIPKVWVHWSASAGKVLNDSSLTDGNGTALSGGWTLGTAAGAQTLTATGGGLPGAVFTADAKAGPVAVLNLLTSAPVGPVGSDVVTPPSVRANDQYGNPVANVPVLFAVITGAGSITGAQQTTNASGVATVGSWKLGTLAGTQSLRADVTATGTAVIITATATSAAPVDLVLVDGNGQIGQANKRLCTSPMIAVRDVYGNGVAQVPVVFTPLAGSGTVTGGSVVSSANTGFASVGSWNLSNGVAQTLVATSTAVPGKQVVFTATVGPTANYSICARFIGDGGTPRQREAITTAMARWQRAIVGHVASARLRAPANQCTTGIPAIDEDVEDLLLYVSLTSIDGPRNIIGQAAPCNVYLPSNLTLMGFLQLDVADLDLMLSDGTLDNVVTHEIGHILGIGTLWNYQNHSLLSGAGSTDPFFTGAAARDQFALIGSSFSGTPVPVENTGGPGTRDSHWRRSIFNNELMQGFSNPIMPMSKVTIGSLADLGYTVNLNAADAFSLLPAVVALRSDGTSAVVGHEMVNDIADAPIWGVEKDGTHRLVRAALNPFKRKEN